MNFNQDLNINYLKSQPTVGELRKVVMTASSPSKQSISTGDNQKKGFSNVTNLSPSSDVLNNININNIKCKAVKQGDVFRELGIKVL